MATIDDRAPLTELHAAMVDAVLSGAGTDEVARLASQALGAHAAAAIAVALEAVKRETERNLRGSFLEELRSRDDLTGEEIVRRAWSLGCDLARGAVTLCAELTVDRPGLVLAIIAEEHPGALAEELPSVGLEPHPRIYAALPCADGGAEECLALAAKLSARIERFGPVGASSFHSDPAELGRAVRESELMLEVAQRSSAPISAELRHGTYKLLVRLLASHPEELREFYHSTVAAMVGYDAQNRTDLVRTLHAYLTSNCNMNVTAATIFAHRHTIASRLERIRELTGLDPTSFEDRERLGLGLKVHRLLAPLPAALPDGRSPGAKLLLPAADRQQRLA